jgi:hypothetical protein
MTAEVKVVDPVIVDQAPVVVDKEVELSPDEQKAISSGWKPKDQYEGDPNKWVDAIRFNERGELFGKISEVTKQNKELAASIEALKNHNTNIFDAGYKKAVAELKALKKEAGQSGDINAVLEYDEQLEKVNEEYKERKQSIEAIKVPTAPTDQEVQQEFNTWVQTNTWYQSDTQLRGLADKLGRQYSTTNVGASPKEVFAAVEAEIKSLFPNKFSNPKRDRPGNVDAGGSTRTTTKPSNVEASLSADEKKVMDLLVKTKVLTKEQYLKDLALAKGIA